MAWGTGGAGTQPHGSTQVGDDLDLSGTALAAFGATAAMEVGVAPDPTVEPFEMTRRTAPLEMLRRTAPLEMTRR